jgi:DNA-binding MarR family transcriptional regulator
MELQASKRSSDDQAPPDPATLASDLRVALGTLMRRLRAENRIPLAHAAVLGRLEREGRRCVSDLAAAERVRPQSMAQTVAELEAQRLVARHPDPGDRRRALVSLTAAGRRTIAEDRRRRQGWLAQEIASTLSERERKLLRRALVLLERIAES